MRESFQEALQNVRRLLEKVGGSASAYEELTAVLPPRSKSSKPSWEEASKEAIHHTLDSNPFQKGDSTFPCVLEQIDSEDLTPTQGISRKELLETFQELGLDPVTKTILEDWSEEGENDCLGDVTAAELGLGKNINPSRYQPIGFVENLGELNVIYSALVKCARGNPVEQVKLDSGTFPVQRRASTWVIEDSVKGIEYTWENVSQMYPRAIREEDNFVWVTLTSERKDLGYLHNGSVFIIT